MYRFGETRVFGATRKKGLWILHSFQCDCTSSHVDLKCMFGKIPVENLSAPFLLLWHLVYCKRVHIYFCLSLQKILAGVDDLQKVKALEMRVDTREISLGNFGKKTLDFLLIILNFALWCLDWAFTNEQPVKSTVLLKSSWNRISLYLTLFDLCLLVWGSEWDWKLWQRDEWWLLSKAY